MIQTRKQQGEVFIPPQMKQRKYTMEVTPEAFSATIDNLYEDIIGSPVREYMANAYDAHRSVNSTANIRVHAPTALENYFEVRDFGPGLSDEDIENYFITLFSSKKKDTNTQVGFFGLGCKAAFTYTNQMIVTSYQGGQFREYNIIRQGREIPVMLDGLSGETSEPDGLRVRYIVKPEDIQAFQESVRWSSVGFFGLDVGVEANIQLPEIEVISAFEDFSILKIHGRYSDGNSYPYYNKCYIQMGAILYRTDAITNLSAGGSLFDICMVKRVPVGGVEPSTSRESLVMNDSDKKLLASTVISAKCAIAKNYYEALDGDPNLSFREKFVRTRELGVAPLPEKYQSQGYHYGNSKFAEEVLKHFDGISFNILYQAKANSGYSKTEFANSTIALCSMWLMGVGRGGGNTIFYTITDDISVTPHGLATRASECGRTKGDTHILIDSKQELDKLKAVLDSGVGYVEVPAKAERKKAVSARTKGLYFDLNGSAVDIETFLAKNPDPIWVPWAKNSSYYNGKLRGITPPVIEFICGYLGIQDLGAVLACTASDAKKAKLRSERNLFTLLGQTCPEDLLEDLSSQWLSDRSNTSYPVYGTIIEAFLSVSSFGGDIDKLISGCAGEDLIFYNYLNYKGHKKALEALQ